MKYFLNMSANVICAYFLSKSFFSKWLPRIIIYSIIIKERIFKWPPWINMFLFFPPMANILKTFFLKTGFFKTNIKVQHFFTFSHFIYERQPSVNNLFILFAGFFLIWGTNVIFLKKITNCRNRSTFLEKISKFIFQNGHQV